MKLPVEFELFDSTHILSCQKKMNYSIWRPENMLILIPNILLIIQMHFMQCCLILPVKENVPIQNSYEFILPEKWIAGIRN